MIILGLTGGIGMGKSAVTKQLQAKHIPVWDADQAVADLYGGTKSGVWCYHRRDFQKQIGCSTKEEARSLVEKNPAFLTYLGQAAAPFLLKQATTFVTDQRYSMRRDIIALDIPLLFEAGWDKLIPFTRIVTVSCPLSDQQDRVLARPGMTLNKFATILDNQLSDDERREKSDFVIDTSGTLEHTEAQVEAVLLLIKNYRLHR